MMKRKNNARRKMRKNKMTAVVAAAVAQTFLHKLSSPGPEHGESKRRYKDCRQYLDSQGVEVLIGLAGHSLSVVLKPEEVEQVVSVVVVARPEDVDFSLADGGRTFVLHVVDVEDLLANLVLVLVLGGQRSGDVVLHLHWVRLAGHPEVRLHPDGDRVLLPVVAVVRSLLGVAGLGIDQE